MKIQEETNAYISLTPRETNTNTESNYSILLAELTSGTPVPSTIFDPTTS